jgi:hypothetical protein
MKVEMIQQVGDCFFQISLKGGVELSVQIEIDDSYYNEEVRTCSRCKKKFVDYVHSPRFNIIEILDASKMIPMSANKKIKNICTKTIAEELLGEVDFKTSCDECANLPNIDAKITDDLQEEEKCIIYSPRYRL